MTWYLKAQQKNISELVMEAIAWLDPSNPPYPFIYASGVHRVSRMVSLSDEADIKLAKICDTIGECVKSTKIASVVVAQFLDWHTGDICEHKIKATKQQDLTLTPADDEVLSKLSEDVFGGNFSSMVSRALINYRARDYHETRGDCVTRTYARGIRRAKRKVYMNDATVLVLESLSNHMKALPTNILSDALLMLVEDGCDPIF
jgi:predicted membrane GTPase involved in stress response